MTFGRQLYALTLSHRHVHWKERNDRTNESRKNEAEADADCGIQQKKGVRREALCSKYKGRR